MRVLKRVVAGVAAAVLIVAVLVVLRTMTVSAPALREAAPPIQVDANLAARHLSESIRVRTVSYGDGVKEKEKEAALDALQGWMERTYPGFHEAAGPEKFNHSLLFTWIGTNPNLQPVQVNNRLWRSEEHTSELQSHVNLVCRLLLEKKKKKKQKRITRT